MTAGHAAQIAKEYTGVIDKQVCSFEEWRSVCKMYFDVMREAAVTDDLIKLSGCIDKDVMQGLQNLTDDQYVETQFSAQDAATVYLWRRYRHVYDIDPDLWAELRVTDDDTVVPLDLFSRLPHPDPFVALPTPLVLRAPSNDFLQVINGFYVTGKTPGLRGSVQRSTHDQYASEIGLLIGGTLEALDGKPMYASMSQDGKVRDMIFSRLTLPRGGRIGDMVDASMDSFLGLTGSNDWRTELPEMIRTVVSALIYICATNAELRPVPVPPKKLANGKRVKDTTSPRVVEVGYRIGAALKAYRKQQGVDMRSMPTGRRMPPHVRRAHLHTYKVGPGRRQEEVKWLSPIPVNAGSKVTKTTVIGVK